MGSKNVMNKLNTNALRQLADDIDEYGVEGTIERWEWQRRDGTMKNCTALPPTCRILYGGVRRKPKTIIVNGVEVPEPLREVAEGQIVWLANFIYRKPMQLCMANVMRKERWLCQGLLHATEEAAQKHMDALTLPSRVNGGES